MASNAPPNALPFSRTFALRIKHVRYERNPTDPQTRQAPDFLWRPSDSGSFIKENASDWWIWDPGPHPPHQHLQRLRPPGTHEFSSYRLYRSCTMIWAPERQHYLHIPIDCTVAEQRSETDVWRRLSFGQDENGSIAVIGHFQEREWLQLPGPERWFPQLLPIAYQSQRDSTQQCGLAGDLSILIGLTAFSTTLEEFPRALDQSFRRDRRSTVFLPHNRTKGPKHKRRIIVVEIAHDPERTSTDDLANWEKGRYGEILS